MRRLFGHRRQHGVDRRPALLSMAALMILLLPTLLLVTSTQKTTALPLSIAGNAKDIPPAISGIISSLDVIATEDGYRIEAKFKRTDMNASDADVEQKSWGINKENDLQKKLRELKNIDSLRTRIRLKPKPSADTQTVIHLLDLLKRDGEGELFPETLIFGEELP